MDSLTMESKVTLKEAYLIMYDYLDKHWEETGKPGDIGALLGELSLWDTEKGKRPMDGSVFPKWLTCAELVLQQEQTDQGYRNADIKFPR